MGLLDPLATGLSTLGKAPQFGRRKLAEWKMHAANRNVPSQRSRIADLLEENEFLLLIFDACRFDSFQQQYPSHYEGDLQQVYTTNTYTKQYQTMTWSDTYDLTYVAGGPVISDRNFELSELDYRPSEHFDEIVPAWDMSYEKELGVTPPEAVTEVALETDASRMVVHYFQPHAPYVGEERLRGSHDSGEGDLSIIEERVESLIEIYDRIEAGEIDEERLRAAYDANLERVIEAAKPLVDGTDRRTVITSDHGELLGEDGRYLHGGLPHPVLCALPWLEVDGIVGDAGDVDTAIATDTATTKNVKEQLQDLGYM